MSLFIVLFVLGAIGITLLNSPKPRKTRAVKAEPWEGTFSKKTFPRLTSEMIETGGKPATTAMA